MHKKQDDLGRFSDPSLLILTCLASGPQHGYAMLEDIAQFCCTRLEPGTLYAALALSWLLRASVREFSGRKEISRRFAFYRG